MKYQESSEKVAKLEAEVKNNTDEIAELRFALNEQQ